MPTQEEIDNAQFRKAESEKIKLEAVFDREIRSLFNRINHENVQSIKTTGQAVSGNKFQKEWEALLRKHYTRVQDSFSGSVEETLPKIDQGMSDEEIALFLAALIFWRDQQSVITATIITNTNNKQLLEASSQARQLLIEQEQEVDNRNLALTAAIIFRRLYTPRIQNIAITETQYAAESTRFMESATLSGENPIQALNPPGLRIESKTTKMWISKRDILVRPIHVEADGQTVELNGLFISGGEFLLFPRDSSNGATAKNISRCRCSTIYGIKRVRR